MNNNTSSTGNGSFTDTLKGYVHKAQEQFTQAGQAHSKTAGTTSTGQRCVRQVNQFNANCAANRPGSTGAHSPNTDDAFAEVNQFNANCAARHSAGNPGFKSSKGAM
jgi:hypothetical protein